MRKLFKLLLILLFLTSCSKNLGAFGDAGGIITNSQELSDWIKLYARHGGKGIHQFEGINSRMDGLQAAILSVKLKKLEEVHLLLDYSFLLDS